MKRTMLVLSACATLAACNTTPTSSASGSTSGATLASAVVSREVTLPSLSSASLPHLRSGSVMLTAESGAGTASFSQAPRWDESMQLPAYGGGAFDIHVGSAEYSATAASSIFDVATDDTGTPYLLLGELSQTATRVEVVYAVVKASDLAAGATIALDGVDRWALYLGGPIDSDEPDTLAVATSGTLTFGATATAAGPLDASLAATFQRAEIDPPPGGEPPSDGGTGPGPAAPPTAGAYTLETSDVRVECTEALLGKEADFTALDDAKAFAGLKVQVAVASGAITLSGLGTGWFATDPITLDDVEGQWQGASGLSAGATGPDGTRRWGGLVALDGASNQAMIGLVYESLDHVSDCFVSFAVALKP